MKKILILFLLSILVLPSLAGIQYVRSSKGGGSGKIQFAVKAPYNTVREILDNDQVFIQFIPGLTKWQVIRESATRQVAKCTMIMSKLMPPSNYLVQVDKISDSELRFKRLTGDLKDLEGSWKLSFGKEQNTTLITYQYKIDTGLSYVPKLVMEKELRKHLQETEARAKSEINRFIAQKTY